MTDRRVVKMRVDYLRSMLEHMRLLNKIDESKCMTLFAVTKMQALENMVAGIERTINQKLAEKSKKPVANDGVCKVCESRLVRLRGGLGGSGLYCSDGSCRFSKHFQSCNGPTCVCPIMH